jgi:hypothetical protein
MRGGASGGHSHAWVTALLLKFPLQAPNALVVDTLWENCTPVDTDRGA